MQSEAKSNRTQPPQVELFCLRTNKNLGIFAVGFAMRMCDEFHKNANPDDDFGLVFMMQQRGVNVMTSTGGMVYRMRFLS